MKRVVGWVVLVLGIVFALNLLGLLLEFAGNAMNGTLEQLEWSVGEIIESVVVGGGGIWLGLVLLRRTATPSRPDGPV